jgi:hypothetical protein
VRGERLGIREADYCGARYFRRRQQNVQIPDGNLGSSPRNSNLQSKEGDVSAKSFATELKEIVEDVKETGTTDIKIDNLIAYLDEVLASPDQEPSEFQLEQYRGELQASLEQYRATENNRLESFRSIIMSGQVAIKSSFFLNGGASIALLAFIGHLVEIRIALVPEFAVSLLWFTLGVLAIAVTSGTTYLSQWLYGSEHERAQKAGLWVNRLCIALGIASYVLFVVGLIDVYGRFRGLS